VPTISQMPKEILLQEERHQFLIDKGVSRAVEWMLEHVTDASILGFSVGGTIAWKFAQKKQNIEKLVLVSSTRIRQESNRPDCSIQLIFGEEDEFKPSMKWAKEMDLSLTLIKDNGHECYKNWQLIAPYLLQWF